MTKFRKFSWQAWRLHGLSRHVSGRLVILSAIFLALLIALPVRETLVGGADNHFSCYNPYVIDGDTLDCGGHRIRLAGIDAPEMPGHCRPGRSCTPGDPFAAQNYLRSLARGSVTCRPIEKDVYGRTVARCEAGGRDLSCAMIAASHAVRRYGLLLCFS